MTVARLGPDAGEKLVSNRLWEQWWTPATRFYAWHLTFDGTGIPDLATRYHRALRDLDGLELVPLPWLHLTLHGVGLVPEIPAELRDRVTASVARELAVVAGATTEFAQWSIDYGTISVRPVSAEPFHRIRAAVRRGLADALGADGLREPAEGFEPHVTLAFLTADQPAGPVVDRLEAVGGGRAAVTVRQASLLEMYRADGAYRWRRVAEARLR